MTLTPPGEPASTSRDADAARDVTGGDDGVAVPPSASVAERLRRLVDLPDAPVPVGAYVPAVRSGDLVFTSGQLPLIDGRLQITGPVGDQPVDVSLDTARGLARRAAVNALAAIATVVPLSSVRRVVKVTGYVASTHGFDRQPAVVDGASTLLTEIFGDAGRHARSAVGVSILPLNASVEIELVVQIDPAAADAAEASRR